MGTCHIIGWNFNQIVLSDVDGSACCIQGYVTDSNCIESCRRSFIVESFINTAVLRKVDRNQFEVILNSSTTHVLVSMIHNWNKLTDGSGQLYVLIFLVLKKLLT